MQGAMKDLQDAGLVLANLKKGPPELLQEHSDRFVRIEAFHERTKRNLAEITIKLNRLIGHIEKHSPE